jgi:energy-converting hydrogenase A subunit M
MAPLAQALKWTEPEFIDVAMVRLDMIALHQE